MTDWVSEPPNPAPPYPAPPYPAAADAPPLPPTPPREPWLTTADLRFGAIVIAVFAVTGIAAGAVWAAVSSTTRVYVQSASVMISDETEGFISADGRYLIITAAIGLVMGLAVWLMRDYRGPVAAAALGVGGFLGALLTASVGNLLSSGKSSGAINTVIDLKVSLHGHGLVVIEPALALLVYLIGTLFVSSDDLNRSVPAGRDVQALDGNRHGPGGVQDRELPAQQGDFGR